MKFTLSPPKMSTTPVLIDIPTLSLLFGAYLDLVKKSSMIKWKITRYLNGFIV